MTGPQKAVLLLTVVYILGILTGWAITNVEITLR